MRGPLSVFFPLLTLATADVITGVPDSAPPGFEQWTSPVVIPAKNVSGDGDWASAVARAREFVSKLTIEEKVNVTTGVAAGGRCPGITGTIPRFNWPGLCLENGPQGVYSTDYASAFPAAINAAATWDKDLIYRRAQAMGVEFRGKGVNIALAPTSGLARVVAGGRNWEAYGADPYLSGVSTALTVRGIQETGVMANVKHLIANDQEHFRADPAGPDGQIYSSNVDDRTLHELHLWPFADAVEAGVASVMCAYNKVNQTQSCQNSKLLNGLIKEELDFQGFIMSDWTATINGVQPALAGMDMTMPGVTSFAIGPQDEPDPSRADNSFWGAHLVEAVRNGSVPEHRLDDMVIRIFAPYYKLGQDKDFPPVNFHTATSETIVDGIVQNEHIDVQGDHYKVIREVGAASTVLLKNTGNALPLNLGELRHIGIFGSDAGPNPSGPNSCIDRACDQGTLAMGWGSGSVNFPYLIDPYTAIQNYVNQNKPTTMLEAVLEDDNAEHVRAVARYADACLVFVNADSGENYLSVGDVAGDRNNLTLWHNGEDLILNTAAECSNTIVTMHAVGAVVVESWIDHPNVTAVLSAHLPGQESGNSLVDVLFGNVNPSGRLPYTMAKRPEDYPAQLLYQSDEHTPQITYSEGLNIDYRHFDAQNIEPRFEFGFGLSYTTFEYSAIRVDEVNAASSGESNTSIPEIHPGGAAALWENALNVSFTVRNTGGKDGHEVSQLYIGFPEGTDEPPRVLRGFERTFIAQGQSASVTIPLKRRDISIWDVVAQKWVVPTGSLSIEVGSSSRKIHLTATHSY